MDSRVFEGEEVVRVCVRVRRLLPRELKSGKSIHWNVESNRIWSPEDPRQKVYAFDSVLDSSARNGDVFESLCQHIVSSTFLGFNGTIFAYGQTSSGKTHTMMGDEDEPGIIPAAVDAIFDLIEATPSREFLLRVSYFEIYNENVVDLISESMEGRKRSLQLKEDTMGNIIVDGATELTVTEPNEIMHWLCYGEQHRHVGATNMNERSSRSHTIFRLIIESTAKQDPKAEDEELSDGAITVSHLNLVDLAGSERVSQAGTGGKSLREGGNINKSLLVLSQVISKLSEGSREFVPFRDSKLTRILKSSLGGNARTAIICTVTPAEREQTKSTLEFAFRAKNIVQHAQVNEVLDDKTYMRRLKKEMATLRQELEAERNGDRAVQEERWKSALSEKDREMQEMERERENLQTAIEVKEKQLQGLTERLLSGEAGPSHIKQNRRETWAPAPSKKANRRMSFFPRLLSNNNQEVSLEGNDTSTSVEEESPVFDRTSEHNVFVSDRSRRKTVRFGQPSFCDDEAEFGGAAFSTPPSILRKKVSDLTHLLETTQREYSELQEFTQLENNLMMSASPDKSLKDIQSELRNVNKSKADLETLLLTSNKELHEARLKIKDLEENVKSIKDDNFTKAGLKTDLSVMESNYSTSEAEKDRLSRELKDLREKSEFLEREKEDFEFRFSLLEDKYKKKEMDLIQSLNEARSMSGSPNTSSDPSPFGDVTLSAIEELTKRLESLQNYVNDLEDEVRSNKEGVSAKDTLIEELTLKSSDAESLQAIIAELKVSNEGKDEEIRRLNTEQSTSQSMQEASSNTEEEEELSHLKNELYTSKEKISELEDNAMVILNDYEILEKDKAELESQNEALQNKIKALSSVDQETNEDEKDAVLKELRDSLERYSVEIQSLSEEKRKLLHALTEKEAQIKNNQIVKCQSNVEHTEGSSETNAKLQDTIKELSEKTDTISILSFECKDLSSQVQALKDQVSKLSEAKTDLQLKNEKLESNLKSQHKEESSNVDDGKIVSLESESSSKKNEEIEAMKADLNIVTAELDNIKTENKKLGDLLREKESLLLSTNINKPEEEPINLSQTQTELKVTTLEHNLKDKSDSLSKFEDENQKLRAKISELESESSRKGNELHDLRSLLDKINSELSSASEEQMKLQQVVAEKEFLLKDSKEKINSLMKEESDVSQLQSRLHDSLKDAQKKAERISSLDFQIKALGSQIEEGNALQAELEGSRSSLEQRLHSLESELKEKNETSEGHLLSSEELRRQCSSLERKSSEKAEELNFLQSSLKKSNSECEDVKGEMKKLVETLGEKDSRLKEIQCKLKSLMEETSCESSQVENRLQECLSSLEEKEEAIFTLSSECKALGSRLKKFMDLNNELRESKSLLESQVRPLEEKEKKARDSVDYLSQEILRMKDRVSQQEEELVVLRERLRQEELRTQEVERKQDQHSQLETISALKSQLVSFHQLEEQNHKLSLEVQEARKENLSLQKEFSKISESSKSENLDELKDSLKASAIKNSTMEVELVYRDKAIEKLKSDLEFMVEKSNAYREELRRVQNENVDTTVYNEPKRSAASKSILKPDNRVDKAPENLEDDSLAISTDDVAAKMLLKVKEHDIARLRKEIKDRIAHEKNIMASYHKWKQIAKDLEEQLKSKSCSVSN